MPIDKNTGKSKGFVFLNVPQHVYNELITLHGIEFQNHCIRIEARTTKQTQDVPLNKQNILNPTIMRREKNVRKDSINSLTENQRVKHFYIKCGNFR